MSQIETEVTRLRDEFIDRRQKVYGSELRASLEAEHVGRFVAIEPHSGHYFLGGTGAKAPPGARAEIPNSVFFS